MKTIISKTESRLPIFRRFRDRSSSFWKNVDDSFKIGTLLYLITRVWLTVLSIFIYLKGLVLSPLEFGGGYYEVTALLTGWRGALLGMWQRWDTIHYQAIAQWGYNQTYLSAFFPGYPLLSHGVAWLLHISDLAALLLVSNIFCWLSLVLLYRIVRSLFDQPTATLTLIFMVVFPTSFFLFAGYPQSMALFFILFCYWEAKQGRWLWAALAALIAGLTHGTVVPLCLMLAWQAFQTLRHTHFSLRWIISFVPFLPLGGIALFLSWRISQGFESFVSLQKQWYRVTWMPWNPIILGFKELITSKDVITFISYLICLFLIVVAVWSVKKLPGELKIYSTTLLLFLFSTGAIYDPLKSLNRFALLMFPAFILMAVVTAHHKRLRLALIEFSFIFCVYFSYLFLTWRWVG